MGRLYYRFEQGSPMCEEESEVRLFTHSFQSTPKRELMAFEVVIQHCLPPKQISALKI
jgi:hypothetical protein